MCVCVSSLLRRLVVTVAPLCSVPVRIRQTGGFLHPAAVAGGRASGTRMVCLNSSSPSASTSTVCESKCVCETFAELPLCIQESGGCSHKLAVMIEIRFDALKPIKGNWTLTGSLSFCEPRPSPAGQQREGTAEGGQRAETETGHQGQEGRRLRLLTLPPRAVASATDTSSHQLADEHWQTLGRHQRWEEIIFASARTEIFL